MIYAVAHRSVYDAARMIAYVVPHSYIISGDERAFYCTINEYLLSMNGILHFDRTDAEDSRLIVERVSRLLNSGHAIHIAPEGVPNVYGREMLKLYPGVIKMALNSGAVIVPVGNEIHIKRDKQGKRIIGDINYCMYENYHEQAMFRPSDDVNLAALHNLLRNTDFISVINNPGIDEHIRNDKFVYENVVIDVKQKLDDFLEAHPSIKAYVSELLKSDNARAYERVNNYLIKCAVICEYRKLLASSLNTLEQRMRALSGKIDDEINRRHPLTQEELAKNCAEYVDFYLDVLEVKAKKGRSNAIDEIDRYINRTTAESITASETEKVLEGLTHIKQGCFY